MKSICLLEAPKKYILIVGTMKKKIVVTTTLGGPPFRVEQIVW